MLEFSQSEHFSLASIHDSHVIWKEQQNLKAFKKNKNKVAIQI